MRKDILGREAVLIARLEPQAVRQRFQTWPRQGRVWCNPFSFMAGNGLR
jgi:hypothetical protein